MRYVVLGSSAAGINAVREIRKLDKDGEIILISRDERFYSRCILHHYLGNIRTVEELNFAEKNFTELYHINWKKGCAAVSLDCEAREVVLENKERVPYDKLLIATGSHTFIPPVKGMSQAENVIGFRNLEDIETIKEKLPQMHHIVVMGAGLVGLDTVSGLLENGVKPVIVELADRPLCKQLDKRAASVYEKALKEWGVRQFYGTGIQELVLNEKNQVTELLLSDGTKLPCDFLIVTAGVRSNVEFLEGSGVETDKFGLIFNSHGETNVPDVYGAGDVSGRAPIWPVAVKEGIIAGSSMAGKKREMADFFASKSTMSFFGIPTMSLGICEVQEEGQIAETEESRDGYKKIIHENGKILGAIIQGDLSYSGVLQQLIARRIDISRVKKPVFEIDYSDFFHMNDNFEFCYQEDVR